MLGNKQRAQRLDNAHKPRNVYRDVKMGDAMPFLTHGHQQGHHNDGKPSRLELMRAEYQKKLMKEKEEKLIQMYEDHQKQAMVRVARNGHNNTQNDDRKATDQVSVRDFFNERRRMEANGVSIPSIHNHYRQATGSSSAGEWSGSAGSGSSLKTQRTNFGRDRLQPLAPIQRSHPTQEVTNKTTRPGIQAKSHKAVSGLIVYNPFSEKPNSGSLKSLPDANSNFVDNENNSGFYDPNIKTSRSSNDVLLVSQNNRSIRQQLPVSQQPQRAERLAEPDEDLRVDSEDKLTDFQKWRMKQEKPREERFKKLTNSNNSSTSKGGTWKDLEGHKAEEVESDFYDNDKYKNENKTDNYKNGISSRERELLESISHERKELEKTQKAKVQEVEREQKVDGQKKKRVQKEVLQNKLNEERKNAEKKYWQQKENKNILEAEREEVQHNEVELGRKGGENRMKEVDDLRRHNEDEFKRQKQKKVKIAKKSDNSATGIEGNIDSGPAFKEDTFQQYSKRNAILTQNSRSSQPAIPKRDSAYLDADHTFGPTESSPTDLVKCQLCGRSFLPDRLKKHQDACAKVSKPRKEYDSSKKRAEGTDMARYTQKAKRQEPPKKKSNWREKHEEFIQSLKYAKKVTEYEKAGMDTRTLTPQPASKNPDYVPCPHCGRTFNETAAQRHIPRCPTLKTRPQPMSTKRR